MMEIPHAFTALYREQVLEHGRAPQHVGEFADAQRHGQASNPLCGDRLRLGLCLDAHGRISALRHVTEGCLICTASASLMAGDVIGRDALGVAERLQALRDGLNRGDGDGLGDLAALTGVSAHPSRHRCALLPWDALLTALADETPA